MRNEVERMGSGTSAEGTYAWVSDVGEVERKYVLTRDESVLSYRSVIDLWASDRAFRTFFTTVLRTSQFSAYRWETPPVTLQTGDRNFEFVLIDSPNLTRPTDGGPFEKHLVGAVDGVADFENLGGDASLVVPAAVSSTSSVYVHLAAFTRGAPQEQQDALWKRVGEVMRRRLSDRPAWLSTAGGGVAWLHVRVDDRPKYYGCLRYRGI